MADCFIACVLALQVLVVDLVVSEEGAAKLSSTALRAAEVSA